MFKSGLVALDTALFDGQGVPPGTLIELYGTQDSGKTALALWFCRTHQQASLDPVGWICAETNITKRNLLWAGVDPEMLIVRQTFAMPGLQAARLMLEEGCKLVILDSIAALLTETSDTPLYQLLSADLYKVKALAVEQQALVILTNQERSKPPGRSPSRAGVCPALNRLVDCHVRLQSGQGLYRGGVQEGVRIYFQITKNGPDFNHWGRVGRFNISYAAGLKNMKNVEG